MNLDSDSVNVLGMRSCKRVHVEIAIMYTFTELTLQAATAITCQDVIVTENQVKIISVLLLSAVFVTFDNVYSCTRFSC